MVALATTLLSMVYETKVSSEGFFSFYQGDNYTGFGFPWMFRVCLDAGGCFLKLEYFLANFIFFFAIFGVAIFTFNIVSSLLKKTK